MKYARKISDLLLALAVIGYISINIFAKLPPFLIGENLIYATIYGVALYKLRKTNYSESFLVILIAIIGFNIGRVSRSVLTPEGSLTTLAIQHTPLLVFLVILLVLEIYIFFQKK